MDKKTPFETAMEMTITKLFSDAMEAYKKGDIEAFRKCVYRLEECTGISRDNIGLAVKLHLNSYYGLSMTKGENDET